MSHNPLRLSPLRIELHEFESINISASTVAEPNGAHNLRTNRSFKQIDENGLQHKITLTVEIVAENSEDPCPYTGSVTVVGYFTIAENYPENKRKDLIEITGSSILYGACREMITNLTARSSHGILSLPSISFMPNKAVKKKTAAKKVGKKTVKKKSTKKKA